MLYDTELARRINGRIVLRPGGLRVKWTLSDLATADGHRAEAVLSCAVRALPSATDQKMLEEALLTSRPVVTGADVVSHFAGPLEAAAKRYTGSTTAQALMSLVDQAGARRGKYTVDVRGAYGVQIGDLGRQDNVFNAPRGG